MGWIIAGLIAVIGAVAPAAQATCAGNRAPGPVAWPRNVAAMHGGSLRSQASGALRLQRDAFVRGAPVSGRLDEDGRGRLRVGGRIDAVVTIAGGEIRRVRLR